jgi:hypothetical protein
MSSQPVDIQWNEWVNKNDDDGGCFYFSTAKD